MQVPDGGFQNVPVVIGVPVADAGKEQIDFGFEKRPVLNVGKLKAVVARKLDAVPADLVVKLQILS